MATRGLLEWFKSPSHVMVFRWDPGYLMPPPWSFVNLTSLLVWSRCMTAEQGSIGYNLAAWSCVNATAGQVISAAPLHGLSQTNDRAELTAALSALQWQHKFQVDMDIWIDALHVVQGLDFVLLHGVAGHWMNQDIWIEIVDILAGLHGLQTRPHWIPSHLDSNALTCPFEDWIKKWNDHADTLALAGQVNANRPEVLLKLRSEAQSYHRQVAARIKQLRAFSFKWLRNPNLPCWLLFLFMILMKRSHSRSLLCTCQGFLSCFRLHQVNPRSAMNSFPLWLNGSVIILMRLPPFMIWVLKSVLCCWLQKEIFHVLSGLPQVNVLNFFTLTIVSSDPLWHILRVVRRRLFLLLPVWRWFQWGSYWWTCQSSFRSPQTNLWYFCQTAPLLHWTGLQCFATFHHGEGPSQKLRLGETGVTTDLVRRHCAAVPLHRGKLRVIHTVGTVSISIQFSFK